MIPIRSKSEIMRLQSLASEITSDEHELNTAWVRKKGWKVVPVEDGNHFSIEDISSLVEGLRNAGYSEFVAVATEDLGDFPSCYRAAITNESLQSFNQECGLFRYLVMDEARSWAISCNEWYNLFAAEPPLLEAMLGKSIETARREYLNFARQISREPDEALMKVATHYAEL